MIDTFHRLLLAPDVDQWVKEGAREDWTDRYLMAVAATRTYDGRIPIRPFLGMCWKRKLIDRRRRHARADRPASDMPAGKLHLYLEAHYDPPLRDEPCDLDMRSEEWDIYSRVARGLSLPQVARSIRVPLGTVKSRMSRMRGAR